MRLLQDIREVFRTLKHRKRSKVYCPRCGSPEIHFSSSTSYLATSGKYVCESCGYAGPIVMELEKEEG